LLIERLSLAIEFTNKVGEFVDESKQELVHLKRYRLAVVVFSGLLIAFLLGFLVCAVFRDKWFFLLLGPYTRSAIILATLAGTIVLVTVVAKSVFKSSSERFKDELLPPHIKEIIENARKMLGQ